MGKAPNRAYIVQQINLAAALYRQNLVGRRFLYVFDNRYIEVLFHGQNFRHLTGVDTKMDAITFYKDAVRGRLQANKIYFSWQHPSDICLRKVQHICNIASMMTDESLMLEEVTTNTKTYAFGTTDLNFTLCLDREYDPNGKPKGECYVAQSLRDGDNMSKSKDVYVITHIFSKPNTDKKYTTLCYMDKNSSMDDLPDDIRDMIDLKIHNSN